MPREGYGVITVSDADLRVIDEEISGALNCRTRPETLRQMIRVVREQIKNAVRELLARNLLLYNGQKA